MSTLSLPPSDLRPLSHTLLASRSSQRSTEKSHYCYSSSQACFPRCTHQFVLHFLSPSLPDLLAPSRPYQQALQLFLFLYRFPSSVFVKLWAFSIAQKHFIPHFWFPSLAAVIPTWTFQQSRSCTRLHPPSSLSHFWQSLLSKLFSAAFLMPFFLRHIQGSCPIKNLCASFTVSIISYFWLHWYPHG